MEDSGGADTRCLAIFVASCSWRKNWQQLKMRVAKQSSKRVTRKVKCNLKKLCAGSQLQRHGLSKWNWKLLSNSAGG